MEHDEIWTTKSGDRIPIKDLDDRHLLNIVRFLHRTAPEAQHIHLKEIGETVSMLRSECAQDDASYLFEEIVSQSPAEFLICNHPQWDALSEEIKKRKLQSELSPLIVDELDLSDD